jgi:hypothetical protein
VILAYKDGDYTIPMTWMLMDHIHCNLQLAKINKKNW